MTVSDSPMSLALVTLRGRWFMAYASFLIMSAAGATYIFAIYSKDIKTTLGYDQQTLNTLGFFKDLGANVGIHAGLIAEVTPTWTILAIGSAMNFFGYFMIYLAITGKSARPHVWQMCLYIAIGANSQAFANTGALVTCVKNFPESRGVVLGLLKGFVGLSGAIFTQLYLAFYGTDSKSLVLLIAWLPAAISAVFLRTIRLMKPARSENEMKTFCSILYISLALAIYLMVAIILQKRFTFNHAEYGVSAAVVLFLLFLPVAVVIKEEIKSYRSKSQLPQNNPQRPKEPISGTDHTATKLTTPADSSIEAKGGLLPRIVKTFKSPKHGEDYTILQALVSIDMIILFIATVFGVGGTLTAIDNMGQIGESLGYPQRSIATFVSLISIWNYAGRVASGFGSEILLSKYKLPRPVLLAFVLLLSCVGHLLIAFGLPFSLYISSVVIGFCFGAAMPLILGIISELFGLKYYSTLYNFGGMASPVGSYLLNVRVAGRLYDREAERQNGKLAGSSEKALTCIGVQCYKHAFLIITAVTVASAVVMLVLAWRTREFYRGDIYAKFREGSESERVDSSLEEKMGEKSDSK
ncbi:Major facilitator superfamily protein [Rhynchospora pubera]|uniref:Major facilitator superfamily protein n=1 Tax=Rhynchospora pubera TaxID=906938 RepID=A0AAV8DJK9_9POAL|nr:Major facilitator superfamily protein [Rhynchospora pubera]